MADPDMTTDAPPAPADDTATQDNSSTTLVTICKEADGSYMVYAGEKPEGGAADEGADHSSTGKPAESVGAALKATLDILKAGEGGDEQGDFQAGYDGGSNASPPKAPPPQPMA